MGGACGKASKDAAKYRRASIRPGTESAYKTGPLSRKAIVQRLSVVDVKETEYGPGFKICYAAVSQRGYYPEGILCLRLVAHLALTDSLRCCLQR